MRTRMVEFGGINTRLKRIVRQTARELNKSVDMRLLGDDTEVDRTILDRIVAPLEHMLRNAISHGIELAETRRLAGKPETGLITIDVSRQGQNLTIKVQDDGAGINIDAIRKKAYQKGLIDSYSKFSDRDVLQFILESGFSTAETVTQISGRGVGMDVVSSEIKQLGGVLQIDTESGKGTLFTVHLPLSLSIYNSLLVNIHDEVYAVPLSSIEGVVRLTGAALKAFYNVPGTLYEFTDHRYEVKYLGSFLDGKKADFLEDAQQYPVLLIRVGDRRVAMQVDSLMGRREVVVKSVGPQLSKVRGISGATILGDGRVVLILDVSALLRGETIIHIGGTPEEVPVEPVTAPMVHRTPQIMVVDDSITIRKVTQRMLSRHGMETLLAKDGVDAVTQLQENVPDLILLDIEMPRMDGYELATHVKNNERLKHVPIIMITSRSGIKHREKAKEIGVERYLGKPYQEEALMKNIQEMLGLEATA